MLILLELPPTLNDKKVHVPAEPIKQLIQPFGRLIRRAVFWSLHHELGQSDLRILELENVAGGQPMFCNRCGTTVQPEYNLCPKCGALLSRTAGTKGVQNQGRLDRHLRTLGTLWIIVGVLFLIPAAIMLAVGGAAHFVIHGEPLARFFGPIVLSVLGAGFFILAAGGICIGWGLMQRQAWARIAAIILGILALFHPPIGTALGIYTLWVLLSDDAGGQYERLARAA